MSASDPSPRLIMTATIAIAWGPDQKLSFGSDCGSALAGRPLAQTLDITTRQHTIIKTKGLTNPATFADTCS